MPNILKFVSTDCSETLRDPEDISSLGQSVPMLTQYTTGFILDDTSCFFDFFGILGT